MYYRKHGKPYVPEYERPGRTKQSFKDDCDINFILKKAQTVGSLSHLEKYGAVYGDFSEAPTDLLEAHQQLDAGKRIFQELPSEIRREFKNNAFDFFKFVNDPENKDDLANILPALAKPGSYFPDVGHKNIQPNEPQVTPENTPETPSEAPEG